MRRRMHKGFTLVELLIVVAILSTLAASISISTADATARAKAAAIASNVAACKNGAALYYSATFNDTTATGKPNEFLSETSTYVPNWKEFATGGTITYAAGEETTPETWSVTVNFKSDKEAAKIATALSKMPGYKSVQADNNQIKVTLLTGAITATTES